MRDFDDTFRAASRHQLVRTIIICGTCIVIAWMLSPVLLALVKH